MTQGTTPAAEPAILDYGRGLYPPASREPTRVRYGVLAFMCSLALLLYLDRVCIGKAAPLIRRDLGLTETDMAWVFNAFTLAYCLFEVPAGHWGDRHGSRGIITRIVVWWSAFTALTGAAMGMWSLVALRFLFGAGEAGAFPNAARVVTRWFPVASRGKARGAITTTSLVGGALSPVLAAVLIGYVGWRGMFAVFGFVGIAWAAVFYAWFRDDPAEHKGVNPAELALVRGGADAERAGADDGRPDAHARLPWGRILTSPNTWLLGAAMTFSGVLSYMQFQWYPTYLEEARGQSQLRSGWLTGMIMAGGALGCVAGGLVADAVVRRTRGSERGRLWGRRLCGSVALLMACLSVLGVRFTDSVVLVTVCHAAAQFFVQAAIPTWWSVVAEVSGRHGAAMWGLMNSMAGLTLMGTTWGVGRFVQTRKAAGFAPVESWELVFTTVAVGLALGAFCWLRVDPTRSIVEPAGGRAPGAGAAV